MASKARGDKRRLPSLRSFLLMWLLGGGLLIVIAYTALLEYYLDLGVDLRTDAIFRHNAGEYVESLRLGQESQLPSGVRLRSYRDYTLVPATLRKVFPKRKHEHGEVLRHINRNYGDGDHQARIIDTGALCGQNNCEFIFFYPYRVGPQDWLYMVQGLVDTEQAYQDLEFTERVAFAIGVAFFGLFLLLSILIINRVGGPLSKLERWTDGLDTGGGLHAVPQLSFREYDALAHRLRKAMERIGEDAEREKRFLGHASHELRTPIAILSSNLELLERLTEPEDAGERGAAERAAFLRQHLALRDIQQLTETLLWLYRQTDALPGQELVELGTLADSVVEENRYLIHGRAVAVEIRGKASKVSVPRVALRIVLSNLVRNAMQYTLEGEVTLSLTRSRVVVENANQEPKPFEQGSHEGLDQSYSDADYGFGLGLDLVERICQRLGWGCEIQALAQGYRVQIDLGTGQDKPTAVT